MGSPGRQDISREDDEIDLRWLLAAIVEGRWLITGILATTVLLGVSYYIVARPVFHADALIQVEGERDDLSDLDMALAKVDEMFGQREPDVEGEMQLIRSRLVLGRAVDSLHMTTVAEAKYFPLLGRAIARLRVESGIADPTAGRSCFAWGGETIKVARFEVPKKYIERDFTLVALGGDRYRLFDPNRHLLLDGHVGKLERARADAGEITAQLDELRAHPGTEFRLVSRPRLAVIAELQKRLRVTEKGAQSNIIELAFEDTGQKEVAAVVDAIADQYIRQNVERRSAEAAQRLAFLERQLPGVKHDLENAEDALSKYRDYEGAVDLDKEAQSLLTQIVTVDQELTELRRQREVLVGRFTPAHPLIMSIDSQTKDLREVARRLEARIRTLPQMEQQIVRLTRNVQISTSLYTGMLNTYQQLQVIKAGTLGNVRVVDRAAVPLAPVAPTLQRVLLVSVLLGLSMGVGAVLLMRELRGAVTDPELLEQYLGLPVYAAVLHSRGQTRLFSLMRRNVPRDNYLLAATNRQDPAVESLRNLCTALHFSTLGASSNVLMIAGSMSGVGKSFTAINLAAILALSGKRVLAIDADMRRGCLHEYVNQHRERGLSEVLSGAIPLEHATRPVAGIDRMELMSSGAATPVPAELLLSDRLPRLLEDVRQRYDYVVIDTPPVLALADARVIARYAGATLFVLRSERRQLRQAEHALRRLRQAGANIRGILLNDIRPAGLPYGYGYGYGYGYDLHGK